MSRRHHHRIEPFVDYNNRYNDFPKDPNRPIEYQDDLSPVNSDEEGYLVLPAKSNNKSENYYMTKANTSKPSKHERSGNGDNYQKDAQYSKDAQFSKKEKYPEDSRYSKQDHYVKEQQYPKDHKYKSEASYKDAPRDLPRDMPRDLPRDVPRDLPRDVPRDLPRDVPRDLPRDMHSRGSGHNVENTSDRLTRLESMLEQLVKRDIAAAAPGKELEQPPNEKEDVTFLLEPRKHSFTTSMWINKIQEVSVLNNWNEKNTIQYMESQLSGTIKAWYKSLPNYDFTWPEWKILISKTFPDNCDFVTTLKRLVTRLKQTDETMTNYYFSKMYLIEACKISGEDAVSCLIDGLNNQVIQAQAKAQNFLTPETLFSQYLMTLPDYTVDYTPANLVESDASALNTWYYPGPKANEERPVELHSTTQEMSSFEYPDQDVRPQRFEYDNENIIVDRERIVDNFEPPPKRPVHSRLDKGFKRYQHRQPLSQKICTVCYMKGHIARQCRKAKNSMLCQLENGTFSSCYFKECLVNNSRAKGLVDTGCDTVTIRKETFQKLGLVGRPSGQVIRGFGNGATPVLEEVEVYVEVDGVGARVVAMVVPDEAQNTPLVIGQAFLNQPHIGMILKDRKLTIFDATTC